MTTGAAVAFGISLAIAFGLGMQVALAMTADRDPVARTLVALMLTLGTLTLVGMVWRTWTLVDAGAGP